MKEYWLNTDPEFKVLLVVNKYGDGMMFKYDGLNECYSMSTIGNPTANQIRNLIEKYDHN